MHHDRDHFLRPRSAEAWNARTTTGDVRPPTSKRPSDRTFDERLAMIIAIEPTMRGFRFGASASLPLPVHHHAGPELKHLHVAPRRFQVSPGREAAFVH